MIRILQIVSSLGGGGVENLLFNYYSNMDRNEYVFDFIVHDNKIGILEEPFKLMNSKVFHVSSKHDSIYRNLKSIYKIIKIGNYDVVHVHQDIKSVFPIYLAKRSNVKIRIAHSHNANKKVSKLCIIRNRIFLVFLKKYCTHWCACGIDAGIYLWGKNAMKGGKVKVINNAIDIDKFTFDQKIRDNIRKELSLEDKFIIGNVGRFSFQKNHEFLVNIFNDIYQKDGNAVLLLIGGGELENEIKGQVKKLGLTEVVYFLGIRDDVPKLLQAMDVFLLPSRFEGLPVVLIESQTAGLCSFVADTITKEVKVTNLIHYISLQKSSSYWANKILDKRKSLCRLNPSYKIRKAGYDIKIESEKLELLYKSCKIKV